MSDADLIQACDEIKRGLIDADLGGSLYKKRVASGNKGKSGGFRTLIGAVIGEKYFFLYAFAKNQRANISHQEKLALRELAQTFISFDSEEIDRLILSGELTTVGASGKGEDHE
ncbi:type II toxin-antitoxin system RelE/ParE family toxin [Marinomonas arenicola]|nr:type II toxin-antitoxin system RelE/ParE family toxin [Marinomonas sp. KMM3893]